MENQEYKKYLQFNKKIVIVGFGSIGTGVLPLILRHIDIKREQIIVITGDERGRQIAEQEKVEFFVRPLLKINYQTILEEFLSEGDFLINLSVDVGSVDVINWCQQKGVLYLDTVIEPWLGGYSDENLTISERSNYGLRETLLELKKKENKTTAISAHGANPGLVSHFVKQALIQIAKDTGYTGNIRPKTKQEWSSLMKELGVKVIHIAEYDSQVTSEPKQVNRFENTWSIDGFYSEGINQPSELGWGSHEKYFPDDGVRHKEGCQAAIYLDKPGALTLVRTWTPEHKAFLGRVVTHNEAISIADYYTVKEDASVVFRPTVHYAYRPCDNAVLSLFELSGNNFEQQPTQKLLMEEITTGMDELGVLLMGHKKGAYWYGSQLTIEEARKLAPYQNATGLQVTASVLAGVIWAIENPNSGILEADELDYERILEIASPYLGTIKGEYTDWTPVKGRPTGFDSEFDGTDPWQFINFRF